MTQMISDFQEGASAEIRGEFLQTNSRVNFAGAFFGGFFPSCVLTGAKTRGHNPLRNPQQKSNQNLGVSRPKSTLQEFGLE